MNRIYTEHRKNNNNATQGPQRATGRNGKQVANSSRRHKTLTKFLFLPWLDSEPEVEWTLWLIKQPDKRHATQSEGPARACSGLPLEAAAAAEAAEAAQVAPSSLFSLFYAPQIGFSSGRRRVQLIHTHRHTHTRIYTPATWGCHLDATWLSHMPPRHDYVGIATVCNTNR